MTIRGTVRKAALDEKSATLCRECGFTFRMLGRHIPAAHGMSVRDYKIKYGLPLTVGLVCSDTFESMSESKQTRHQNDPGLLAKMLAAKQAIPGVTATRPTEGASPYRSKASKDIERLWNSRKADFAKRWDRGDSLVVMAAHFHCSIRTIRTHRQEFGLPRRVMFFRQEGDG